MRNDGADDSRSAVMELDITCSLIEMVNSDYLKGPEISRALVQITRLEDCNARFI